MSVFFILRKKLTGWSKWAKAKQNLIYFCNPHSGVFPSSVTPGIDLTTP